MLPPPPPLLLLLPSPAVTSNSVTPVVRTVWRHLPLAPSDRAGSFDHAKLRDEVTNLLACFGWPSEWRPLLRKWFEPTWVYDCMPAVRLLLVSCKAAHCWFAHVHQQLISREERALHNTLV